MVEAIRERGRGRAGSGGSSVAPGQPSKRVSVILMAGLMGVRVMGCDDGHWARV